MHLLNSTSPFLPSRTPAPGNQSSTLSTSLTVLDSSLRGIGICSSVTGLLHLAQCLPGPSVLLHMAEFPPFLRLNHTPLDAYTVFSDYIKEIGRIGIKK